MDQGNFFSTPSENLNGDAPPKTPLYSVAELNRSAKNVLEGRFSEIEVQGEISNFKKHISGHCYFSLKDSEAQIRAVMFRGSHGRLRFELKNGLEVKMKAKVSLYEARGDYQLICSSAKPIGAGDLQVAFEKLKDKLSQEKVFDQKRPLPSIPKKIALITSPTGAALQDMINIFKRRWSSSELFLFPCLVQGEAAPKALLDAFNLAQKMKDLDLIIIGRGGGSMEDLWCFNDEKLIRALKTSKAPTISAVGHEIDFTLCDFVCDKRAPTPSAAAELAVPDKREILSDLEGKKKNLESVMRSKVFELVKHLKFLTQSLKHPKQDLEFFMQKLDDLMLRLNQGVKYKLKELNQTLASQAQMLDSLSPLKVLDRGYTLTTKGEKVLASCKNVNQGDEINIRFSDGDLKAEVLKVIKS